MSDFEEFVKTIGGWNRIGVQYSLAREAFKAGREAERRWVVEKIDRDIRMAELNQESASKLAGLIHDGRRIALKDLKEKLEEVRE